MGQHTNTFLEADLVSSYFMEMTPLGKIAKVMTHKRIMIKEDMDYHLLQHHKEHFDQRYEVPSLKLPVDDNIKEYLDEL
eukprot:7666486-Ditylum_brightwellii.AAC.2